MSEDFIKRFWDHNAKLHKMKHHASWGDHFAIRLEIENIAHYIEKDMNVLDVGCANGFSTFHQLLKHPRHITGIDFSAQMIKYANDRKEKDEIDNVKFQVGDIRKIKFEENHFDLTYTTRVLINLPNWEDQIIGIEECLRVTKKGGKVLLSEAFYEPLVLLNSLRTLKGLSPLVEHDFNRYIKKEKLEQYLKSKELKYNVVDFSSVYYLGSRFLRELVTKTDDYPGYSNPINKQFYELEKKYSGGGFGIQQLFVIYK